MSPPLAVLAGNAVPPRTTSALPIPLFSVVMITFARDLVARAAIGHVRAAVGTREDIEFILVDNNPDAVDRSVFLADFAQARCLKLHRNKGVSARNDGARAARGTFIVFIDDDAFLNPPDAAFERYHRAFRENERLAIVTARHIDHRTGRTPRDCFPHTDKTLDQTRPFKTFRFQGNGFAMRRSAFEAVGPLPDDYFYGLEEIDYAYRVIDRGYEILYDPSIWVVEQNDSGGRLPRSEVEQMRLTNKMIISYKYLPAAYVPLNFILFSAYVLVLNRGRINPLLSFLRFLRWRRRNRAGRTPIGRHAVAYIKACGGAVWK